MVIYLYEPSMCMVRQLKWLEMTATYCIFLFLVSKNSPKCSKDVTKTSKKVLVLKIIKNPISDIWTIQVSYVLANILEISSFSQQAHIHCSYLLCNIRGGKLVFHQSWNRSQICLVFSHAEYLRGQELANGYFCRAFIILPEDRSFSIQSHSSFKLNGTVWARKVCNSFFRL